MEDQLPFQTEINLNFGWRHGYSTSMKSTPYGLPLNSREYFTYFLVGIYHPAWLYIVIS